jgi:hypothetical protein
MLKVIPFDCYKTYLALKNHFTKSTYDYHKYCGKTKASLNSFYKRKDRFFFEKLSRQKNDKEIEDFFVANFVSYDDPDSLWIGEIIANGETMYNDWRKKVQSLSYIFKEEIDNVFSDQNFDLMFAIKQGKHPQILKEYLQGRLSLETMLILERIFGYKNNFDKKLDDPVWKLVSMKLNKYSSFLNIDVFHYKRILKKVILGET